MAKKASENKTEEVKEVKVAAVEEKKAEQATEKKATKKTTGKKTEKKASPAKEEKQEMVFVQFAGEEFVVEEITRKAKEAYIAEGHRASAIKSLRLYIKPEEKKAYYVINEKAAGSIEL